MMVCLFFKQKTAYEMRISDWSSDVCSSDLLGETVTKARQTGAKDLGGPVILLDHADNCGSGGTQDVMMVIAEVLRQGLEDVAVGAVWDPEADRKDGVAGKSVSGRRDRGGRR